MIICALALYSWDRLRTKDSHIKADVIVVMMPRALKTLLALIRNTLSLILGLIFLVWAFQLFPMDYHHGKTRAGSG
jgi:TRAP-type C4-dicarboxylate transport system permease small subunit